MHLDMVWRRRGRRRANWRLTGHSRRFSSALGGFASYVPKMKRFLTRQDIGHRSGMFKLRGIIEISSDANGKILNAIRITQPDNINGAGLALEDWSNIAAMYDQFRVTSMKVRWVPMRPFDPSGTTKYSPLYVFTDFDSVGLSPTNAEIVAYNNMRVFDIGMPFTYYIKIPKLINTAATNVSIPGYMDTSSPEATGAIYLANNINSELTTNVLYGHIIVTYWIKALLRR